MKTPDNLIHLIISILIIALVFSLLACGLVLFVIGMKHDDFGLGCVGMTAMVLSACMAPLLGVIE